MRKNIFFDDPRLSQTREGMPLIDSQREQFTKNKPFQGLSIYNNTPLSLNTLLKVESLIMAGAQVTVGLMKAVAPLPMALAILDRYPVKVLPQPEVNKKYDIHLDCCAELISHHPTIGSVELTQTGDNIYQKLNLDYPVISVNQSYIKRLETVATGISFIKAFKHLTGQTLNHRKIVLFGAGKVGKGIIQALLHQKSSICVVEKDSKALLSIQNLGLGVTTFNFNDSKGIKTELKEAFCIVTATGEVDIFSSSPFIPSDFGDAYLANMGALDEFGHQFSEEKILFKKKPINFSLANPTEDHFIDPILYAHNAAVELLLTGHYACGLYPFPEKIAYDILRTWEEEHQVQ